MVEGRKLYSAFPKLYTDTYYGIDKASFSNNRLLVKNISFGC